MHRVCAVTLLAVTTLHAFADSGAADRAVAEAQTRAASNDFVGAAAKYREAFKADPRPDLMCNVGVAYYKAKDLPRAQRYLDQCLSIGTSLDRAFIDNVKKVLAAVDSALAAGKFTPVELLVQPPSATTSVEGGVPFDEPILGSRRVWFPYGTHKLTVHAEGHVDFVITIAANDHAALPARIALETAPPPPPPDTGSGSAQGSDAGAGSSTGSGSAIVEQPPPPPLKPLAKPSKLAPNIATSASVAVGVAALGFYMAALRAADDAGSAETRMRHDELGQTAHDRQHISWALGGAAGAGAILSGVLWYRYASAPRASVQASGSSGAITLSGRW